VKKSRTQLKEKEGRDYPDYLMACVGGGSNAAGTIYHYIDDERVKIVLAEAGGRRMESVEVRQQFILEEKALFMAHVRW
jgi:tryptophan synthase beta chain